MTANPPPDGAEPGPPDPDEAVTSRLRALSESYSGLPSAVAERLDRTLAELPELDAPETPPVPHVKTPWWRRRYALAGAMLGLVALLGGGALVASQPWMESQPSNAEAGSKSTDDSDQLKKQDDPGSNEDGGSEDQPGAASEPEYSVTYSGHDYGKAELTKARDRAATGDKSQLATQLDTLASDTAARDACLSELTGKYDGTVESVDFGEYEGAPAMIAVMGSGSTTGVVAAVGPDCRAGSADVLGSAKY